MAASLVKGLPASFKEAALKSISSDISILTNKSTSDEDEYSKLLLESHVSNFRLDHLQFADGSTKALSLS